MKIKRQNFFETSDGAHIYFEDRGNGIPLVMVPGFLCTTKFFERNAVVLSEKYRVITMDPRGQGYSSKTCAGNTLKRHAQDIRELIDYLELDDVVLLGWSLAASTVMVYATEQQQHRLAGLVLVDGSLYPFGNHDWNRHRARNYDMDSWLDHYLPLIDQPNEFYKMFLHRISGSINMGDEDKDWIIKECRKTAPWSALEIHLDFCHKDNWSRLPDLTIPVAFFGADSGEYGLDMVDAYASQIEGYCEVHKFYESGHLMFLYEARKFNECLSGFIENTKLLCHA